MNADNNKPARVLVVGDDATTTGLLSITLRYDGYDIRTTSAGAEAVTVAEQWAPDLMVQDGFEVTRFLHGHRRPVPAIFLTPGDQLLGKIPGVTIGGGDYLTKPFSPEELLARARAVLRRTRPSSKSQPNNGLLQFADLELAEDTYEVRRAGQSIQLTPTEFKLLRYLMHNAGNVVSRTRILDHVWPVGHGRDKQVVDTYIFRLRRKVDRVSPPLIHTVRGYGYSLRLPHT